MAEEAAVIEATPAAEPAEPSQSFDASQLDEILNKMRPMPQTADKPAAEPKAEKVETPPEKPAIAPAEPAKAPEKPAAPSPFDPPPSVLGETKPDAPAADEVETEYGTMPKEPPPNFKSKEAKEQYKKWEASHEKLKADLRTLRQESKKAPKIDPGVEAQIADLTRRNEELNAIVERKAVEELPYVVQNFDNPRKVAFSIAAKALENVDVPAERLAKILSMDEKERVAAMDELYESIQSPFTRDRISKAIADIDILDQKKAEFLADRKGHVEQMTQAQKAEQYRQITAQQQQMADDLKQAIDFVTNKAGFEFLRPATEPGAEKWNERVQNDLALIEELALRNTDPKKLHTAIVLGVQAPHYRAAWQNERNLRLAAEKENAEMRGTLPSMAGNGAAEGSKAGGGTGDEMLDAAGVLPTDDLKTMARKLGNYMSTRQ